MTVRYHSRESRTVPDYVCQRDGIEHGHAICQSVNGEHIDSTIGRLLMDTVTPLALDITLAVQQELQSGVGCHQLRRLFRICQFAASSHHYHRIIRESGPADGWTDLLLADRCPERGGNPKPRRNLESKGESRPEWRNWQTR